MSTQRTGHTQISIEQFYFIHTIRINYLISQEIKVNIIFPVKSLSFFLYLCLRLVLCSCSVCDDEQHSRLITMVCSVTKERTCIICCEH